MSKMVEELESKGFICKKYNGSHKNAKWVCPVGHHFEKRTIFILYAFKKNGLGCPECFQIRNSKGLNVQKTSESKALEEFAKFNYQVLSKYKNSHAPLELICDKGHNCSISWDNFSHGTRCVTCKFINQSLRTRQKAYENIEALGLKQGLELVTPFEEYKNKNSRIKFKNQDGIVNETSWACVIVNKYLIFGKPKSEWKTPYHHPIPTEQEVIDYFNSINVTLIGKFIGMTYTIEGLTPRGIRHFTWIQWKKYNSYSFEKDEKICYNNHYYLGKICTKCKNDADEIYYRNAVETRKGYKYFGSYASNKNGSSRILKVQCPKGHDLEISISEFNRTKVCGKCRLVNVDDFLNILKSINYKLIDATTLESFNYDSKHDVLCDKGHIFQANWRSISNGYKCPICYSSTSIAEEEIGDHLISLVLFPEDWYKSKKFEIDIFLPDLKIGIEYCGLYYHSGNPNDISTKRNHIFKLLNADAYNIQLITIFEDEYVGNETKCLNKIVKAVNNKLPKKKVLDLRWYKIPETFTFEEPRKWSIHKRKRVKFSKKYENAIYDCGHITLF